MRVCFVMVALLVLGGLVRGAGNAIVALSAVPAAVRQAADKGVPGVRWLLAVKDSNGWYKLVGKDAGKQFVEYFTNPEGKDGYFRIDTPLNNVPPVVSAALKAKNPAFAPTKVQAIGLEAGKIISYRFQGEGFQGGSAGIYVSVSGRKVTVVK